MNASNMGHCSATHMASRVGLAGNKNLPRLSQNASHRCWPLSTNAQRFPTSHWHTPPNSRANYCRNREATCKPHTSPTKISHKHRPPPRVARATVCSLTTLAQTHHQCQVPLTNTLVGPSHERYSLSPHTPDEALLATPRAHKRPSCSSQPRPDGNKRSPT